MKPGVYSDISNDDYHGGAGISNSGLSLMRKSPLHLRMTQLAKNDNKPREQSVAMMIGTAFHALLLEPECFTRDYCLGLRQSEFPDAIDGADKLKSLVEELNKGRLPKLPTTGSKEDLAARIFAAVPEETRTSELMIELGGSKGAELKAIIDNLNCERPGLLSTSGTIAEIAQRLRDAGMPITLWSDIKAEWMRNNGHRNVLEPEQWDQLHNMRAAVFAHPMASRLMRMEGKAEQSVYWIDKETGELCRCRPDWWPGNFIVDLKTTDDASPTGFAKSIANFSYDVQDAFYTDGVAAAGRPIRAFLFLAVQKDACVVEGQSFGVAMYQMDMASRELGRAKYRTDLRAYAACKAANFWPNYGDEIQPITLPAWNFNQFQHLIEATA